MGKSELVIIIIAIVAVIGIAVFFAATRQEPVEFFTVTSKTKIENTFIEDYKTFKKINKENSLKEEMTSSETYKKHNILEYFSEEYFNDKKAAVVVLYEDDSKGYIYSIDEVIYNESRTEATIKYTYRYDGYNGTLNSAWYNFLFVELDGTVTKVNFVEEDKVEE